MQAGIITVGDEILIGQVIDTNSAWMGQKLSEIGVSIKKIWSVGDLHTEITEGLQQSLEVCDIVFMTGGLGPTKDDITKKAIADFFGVSMTFHQETYERIKRIFDQIGRTMSPAHDDQCLMPDNAHILYNRMGTAPGMLFYYGDQIVISMPGVPYEMKAIMEDEVIPLLLAKFDLGTIVHKTILTSGVGETTIENQIGDIVADFPPNLKVAYLPSLAQVRLRLSGTGQDKDQVTQMVDRYSQLIEARINDVIYGYGTSSLENEIHQICISKGITIGTAESCTGGTVASKIVSIPGSSVYFMGGIVSYSNRLKSKILNVDESIILEHGAVSEATVRAMVMGAIDALEVDVAVSISGIAGPDGGTEAKPVGTIWICAGNKGNQTTYMLKAGKDRVKNIEIASIYALNILRKFILSEY